jgi:hypothetical protein
VNGVGRMIGSMWRPTKAKAINRRTPRAKGRRTGPGSTPVSPRLLLV